MATLGEMNEKQRAKEFKRVAKELKSKDVSIREEALKVAFEEHAYLTEGKGLLSLLEGVAAKKKVLDLSCISLQALQQSYLSTSIDESRHIDTENEATDNPVPTPPSNARILLNLIVENNENLNILQNVSDLTHFKTEVKKKPGVPEDTEGMALEEKSRHFSAEVLAILATDILSMPYSQSICDFFHTVPSITESICTALMIAYTSFQDEEKKESSLDNLNNLLVCLSLLVTFSTSSVEYLLASEVLAYLPDFVKEPQLKLNTLRTYKAILRYTTDDRVTTQHLDAIMEALEATYPTVMEAFSSAHVDPKAKGKPAKGAPPPEEPTDPMKTPSHLLSCLTVIAEILIEYSKANLIISEDYVEKIVMSYDAVVLLPDVWGILHESQVFHDISVDHLCHNVCVLFGTIATVGDANIRKKICQIGGVKLLASIMKESSGIVGGLSEEGNIHQESKKKIFSLRRLAEQAILFLTTAKKNKEKNQEVEGKEGLTEEGDVDSEKVLDFSVRQMGDSTYETDQTLFFTDNEESTPIVPFTLLTDLLSCEDHDVTARVTRAIGAIISNVPDPIAFATQLSIASSVVEIWSKLVETHSSIILSSNSSDIPAQQEEDVATEEVTNEVKQEELPAMDKILTPKSDEVLCWLFRIFDVICRLSPENIDLYSTQENVSNLAKLTAVTGPTGSDNVLQEHIVDVFDVRSYTWHETDDRPVTNIVFRSYLFDVFSLVAASDTQLREYTNGTIPTPPNTALSESTLSTDSSVQIVNKWLIDAAVSIIFTDFGFETSMSKQLKVLPSKFSILNVAVLNSVLSFLSVVSNSGVYGLETAIQSVALPLIENSSNASISVFKSRLVQAMPELAEILPTINEKDMYSSDPEVLKPMHFDSVLAKVMESSGDEEEGEIERIHPASTLMMTSDNLSGTQQLWPFIILSSALLGILNRPDYTAETAEIAFNGVCGFCRSSQFEDANQPAINDIFSAVFLSLGGGVTLSAISGKFGCLKNRQKNIDFLDFLFRRGNCREMFWAEFAEAHAVDEAAAPPTKGKAPPPKKGAPEPTPGYPVSPDEHHQDPSHGPTREVWSYLLSQAFDDLHTHSSLSTASILCIHGMLTDTALALTECGADSNVGDINGITPLMYALLLSNADIVDSLIAADANIDAIDNYGNPVVKYALLSIPVNSVENGDIPSAYCTNPPSSFSSTDTNCRTFKAEASLLENIISAGVDLKVCDADGNFPLQIACSFGFLYVSIGGYLLELRSKFYSSHKLDANGSYKVSPAQVMSLLIENGADVNSCNKSGITPLHICAGFSDIDAMNILLASKASVNSLDFYGFLPLHYCMSCCRDNVMIATNLLVDVGIGRDIKTAEFTDKRTGLSKEEKEIVDLETSLNQIFIDSLDPSSILNRRVCQETELLLVRTVEGANILQLTLSAESLAYDNLGLFFTYEHPTRKNREKMLEYIFNRLPASNREFYLNIDSMGTSILHAATLFFVGDSEVQDVCPKRRKNPILYGNLELQLLDYIFSNDPTYDVNSLSNRPIVTLKGSSSESGWFPVTGAISSNNVALVKFLVEHGVDLNKCNANDFIQQYLSDDTNPVGIKGLLSMRGGETVEVSATIHDLAVHEVAKLELSRPRSRDSASR